MATASSYQVGSLADLISGGAKGTPSGKGAEDADDLFTTEKKQMDRKPEKIRSKKKKKAKQEEAEDKGDVEEAKATPEKKRKRKIEKRGDGGDQEAPDEDEDADPRSKTAKYEDTKARRSDPEADARTVFVGNLPCAVAKKRLKRMFSEFGTVETVRLRGAARPDPSTPKRVAVIKGKFHESRTNISAYVKFADAASAAGACALNGTDVDGYVIRVDMAGGGGKKQTEGGDRDQQHDVRLGVFVGNLPFSLEENALRQHFVSCGAVDSVRLIRDSSTGVGKGFGYVNFKGSDAVELAVKLNGTELDGRAVRVQRCQKKPKKKGPPRTGTSRGGRGKGQNEVNKPRKERPAFQGKSSDEASPKRRKPKSKGERKKAVISKKLLG